MRRPYCGLGGSARLRRQNPAPSSAGAWPTGSAGRAVFFAGIRRSGTGDAG